MNLKEAFRFSNKLQKLMEEANNILSKERNVIRVENTTLTSKVNPGAEDVVSDPTDKSGGLRNESSLSLH